MRALGVPLVPAVAVSGRAVHGWNPAGYAELLGVSWTPPSRLSPAELGRRLDEVLAAAERLLPAIPDERIDWRPPERDRSVGTLGHHVFRLSLAFIEGMDRGDLPHAPLVEPVPPELRTGADIARYGALVRARLRGWFEGAAPDEYARVIDVYTGPQTGHELLERTTWHAAQHLRQLYDLAARLGVKPSSPLPASALQGLPLPDALW
jgi:DinB family protein